ncbi:MAG: SIMPL domain-containing protein [bacterium]|nr:SIMPL domain-containing protein [bacterium]
MLEDQNVKKGAVVVLVLLALFLLVKSIGILKEYRFIGSSPQIQSVITVAGSGEVLATPSIGIFTFTVTEESLLVKEAQDEAARKTNAILKYLKENGVAEKDISTSGYNVYPRYEYGTSGREVMPMMYPPYPIPNSGKQELAAYVVSQSVTVKVRNLDNAGKLIAGTGEIGATNISGLSFDYDDREALVKEARDLAISEAREEAQKLAKSLGVKLVRIVSYNDGGNYYPMYAKAEMAYGRGGDAASLPPEIPVGEEKITANVSITYEIK